MLTHGMAFCTDSVIWINSAMLMVVINGEIVAANNT